MEGDDSSSSYSLFISPSTQIISPSEPYYDLGTCGRKVNTTKPNSQEWFNRGLTWAYGFCHAEAVRCFEQSILADPTNAMAYWGYAYALGPNYNKPWQLFDEVDRKNALRKCHTASHKAVELATDPLEKALAEALTYRFPQVNDGKYKEWNTAYADATEKVYENYRDDLDVAALYAESRMNQAPWQLWDIKTGTPRDESKTAEIKLVLEHAMLDPKSLSHPLILHLYIHLMEMSPTPEVALPIADRLRGLIPDAGHLNHMPSHLDLLVGDWRRAIASSLEAIAGDEKYLKMTSDSDYYTFYRLHNYQVLIYAAMFNGQYQYAIETIDRFEATLPDRVLRVKSPPLIDWLEGFRTVRHHALIRFGKWDEILNLSFPDDQEFFIVTTTSLHYARGVAFALTDRLDEAAEEQRLFVEHLVKVPESRLMYPNKMTDILKVGEAMLAGELEYRRGNVSVAFDHLRESIRRSDGLVFTEPWGWMQPPRHAYAALQLEQGNIEEAAQVYSADLGFDDSIPRAYHHPNNVWALHGFHECLVKLGRDAEAKIVGQQLKLALAVADIPIESSCFCRRVLPIANKAAGVLEKVES